MCIHDLLFISFEATLYFWVLGYVWNNRFFDKWNNIFSFARVRSMCICLFCFVYSRSYLRDSIISPTVPIFVLFSRTWVLCGCKESFVRYWYISFPKRFSWNCFLRTHFRGCKLFISKVIMLVQIISSYIKFFWTNSLFVRRFSPGFSLHGLVCIWLYRNKSASVLRWELSQMGQSCCIWVH